MLSVLQRLWSLTFWRYTNQIIIIIDHRSRLPFISPLGDDICWVSVFQRGLRDDPTDSLLSLILPARSRSCHTLNFVKALKRTQSNDPNQGKSTTGLIFSWPTYQLLRGCHTPYASPLVPVPTSTWLSTKKMIYNISSDCYAHKCMLRKFQMSVHSHLSTECNLLIWIYQFVGEPYKWCTWVQHCLGRV